jgi:hypothetical protein
MSGAPVIRQGRWLLFVAIIAAACGGPVPTTAPPPTQSVVALSVCDLVADMDTLVGRTAVAAPGSYSLGASERCLWVYVTDPSRYVALTVGQPSSHADTIQSFGDGEVIEGVGDEARWWAANLTLSVLVDERSLQVDLQLDDAADPKALAVSIAQAALEQLR